MIVMGMGVVFVSKMFGVSFFSASFCLILFILVFLFSEVFYLQIWKCCKL